MKFWCAGIIGWLGMLTWAVPAAADEVKLSPSIAVREDYNDNLFFSIDDEQDDFLTTIIAGLEFRNRTERATFRLKGALSPFFYRDHDELDDTDVDVLTEAGGLLSPQLRVKLDGRFQVDNRPERDLDVTGLVYGVQERYRYHGGGSIQYDLLENHALAVSYTYDEDDWRGDDPDQEDFQGHTAGFQYAWNLGRWFDETRLLLNAGYGRYDYETAELKSGYATIGLERMLSEKFKFNFHAGARYTDSDFSFQQVSEVSPGVVEVSTIKRQEDVWGGLFSAGLDYLGERTRWNLTLSHDLRTAGGTQGAADLSRLIFNLSYFLLERFSVGFFTGYYVNKADSDEYSGIEQETLTFNFRPFLRWRFLYDFAIEAAYHYTHVRDEVIGETAERNTVYVQLSYEHDLLN